MSLVTLQRCRIVLVFRLSILTLAASCTVVMAYATISNSCDEYRMCSRPCGLETTTVICVRSIFFLNDAPYRVVTAELLLRCCEHLLRPLDGSNLYSLLNVLASVHGSRCVFDACN